MIKHLTGGTLEGAWEEIIEQAPLLTGKRVRVTILPQEDSPIESSPVGVSEADKTLAEALAGLTGVIHSGQHSGGRDLGLSEDETTFGEYLERKRRDNRL